MRLRGEMRSVTWGRGVVRADELEALDRAAGRVEVVRGDVGVGSGLLDGDLDVGGRQGDLQLEEEGTWQREKAKGESGCKAQAEGQRLARLGRGDGSPGVVTWNVPRP